MKIHRVAPTGWTLAIYVVWIIPNLSRRVSIYIITINNRMRVKLAKPSDMKIMIIKSNLLWWLKLWCLLRPAFHLCKYGERLDCSEKRAPCKFPEKKSFSALWAFSQALLMNYDWHFEQLDLKGRKAWFRISLKFFCLIKVSCST